MAVRLHIDYSSSSPAQAKQAQCPAFHCEILAANIASSKSRFPLEGEDSILCSTLKQFASTIDEISSWQQVLATQLTDGMMFPLTRFIESDMGEIQRLGNQYEYSSQEHEKAMDRFCRLSKKKYTEKLAADANEDVFVFRKKYHQTGLRYYGALNQLQYKRSCSMLEPLLGYLHAIRSFFKMGHESISVSDLDEFLSNISASVQSVHSEMNTECIKSSENIASIEQQSIYKYYVEPTLNEDMPYIPPNTNLEI
ncbi:PREDICTED: DCC-interacting protein 13-alpha-like, partial [Priapulus caudatus]|uniref:DCC-interacting protein 13-alpha-like n=1 Tax=Priapulus caudatus TaxID=37621 RepID=A0ABM1EX92_PRICU